jgi:flagellar basal-body rod modification protein FlgD
MEISSLTGAVPSDNTGPSAQSALSRQDFMNILLAEMTHQDPLNPVDNQEFLSQLAQLQTLEATTQLTQGIESLVALQRLTSAGQLIGREVRGIGTNGQPVEGTVDKIVVRGNETVVSVEGTELALDRVEEMWQE